MNPSADHSVQQAVQDFGTWIFETRRRQELSQTALGKKSLLSLSTVRRLEKGKSGVAIHAYFSACMVLGLLDDIINVMRSPANSLGEMAPNGRAGKRVRTPKNHGDKASLVHCVPPPEASPLPTGGSGHSSKDQVKSIFDEQSLPVGSQKLQEAEHAVASDARSSKPLVEISDLASVASDLNKKGSGQGQERAKAVSRNIVAAAADAKPSGFALSVIERVRARGLEVPKLQAFTPGSTNKLGAVLDICRLGASRAHPYSASSPDVQGQKFLLPCRADLEAIAVAIAAFERGQEDERQLEMLMYCATALGGSRPKCTYVHDDGRLGVAKFPSVLDAQPLNVIEMRTMGFAKAAGIEVLDVSLMHPINAPYLLADRYDRSADGGQIPFKSAQSLLMAQDQDEVNHHQLLGVMRTHCMDFVADARQLWRRLVFDHVSNQAGTGLRKIGFLQVGKQHWKLVPAHGLRAGLALPEASAQYAGARLQESLTLEKLMEDSQAFEVSCVEAAAINAQIAPLEPWRKRHKSGQSS